jgi:hypothetical protein
LPDLLEIHMSSTGSLVTPMELGQLHIRVVQLLFLDLLQCPPRVGIISIRRFEMRSRTSETSISTPAASSTS